MDNSEWFKTWFDTKYYHLLYKHRDEIEARQFIDALLHFIELPKGSKFIDVACGKGRHSVYLNTVGYQTIGIDLSENNIDEALQCCKNIDGIDFVRHDIREPFPYSEFDAALNLFTSFGYFDSVEEHIAALQNIYNCLVPEGVFVMDYLNSEQVVQNLKEEETLSVDDVNFQIRRLKDNGAIVKSIQVNDGGHQMIYEERVKAFSKSDLVEMLSKVGFTIEHIFGNYQLKDYQSNSARVIIIASKAP